MSAKRKNPKNLKDTFERFAPPDIDVESLNESYLFECSLTNSYQQICGAFDAKDHQLANFVIEKNLFNKRDLYGKTVFDLAAFVGNKEFIKAILDRSNERIDENVLNLRHQLKSSGLNFMHLACIWNHEALVKYLAEHPKLIIDPALDTNDLASISSVTVHSVKTQAQNPNFKTLGSVLIRLRTKSGETPRELALRYGHSNIVDYLEYAGLRFFYLN